MRPMRTAPRRRGSGRVLDAPVVCRHVFGVPPILVHVWLIVRFTPKLRCTHSASAYASAELCVRLNSASDQPCVGAGGGARRDRSGRADRRGDRVVAARRDPAPSSAIVAGSSVLLSSAAASLARLRRCSRQPRPCTRRRRPRRRRRPTSSPRRRAARRARDRADAAAPRGRRRRGRRRFARGRPRARAPRPRPPRRRARGGAAARAWQRDRARAHDQGRRRAPFAWRARAAGRSVALASHLRSKVCARRRTRRTRLRRAGQAVQTGSS